MSQTPLEICAASLRAVDEAKAAGAHRVELCSGLSDGGLTPSITLIESAVKRDIPVNVLIRPRPGDFLYGRDELDIMLGDVEAAINCGASGIVIGALTPYGDLDKRLLRTIIGHAQRLSHDECTLTLHRAFDLSRDPLKSLKEAAELGFDRVLTSGCAPTAIQGKEVLRWLRSEATKLGMTIMAGGGVNAQNAAQLAEVADELHTSARKLHNSTMIWRRYGIGMGSASGSDEYARMETSRDVITEIMQALKG